MANEIIRPSELPVRTNPVPSEVVPSDNNVTVAGVSWEDGVNSAVPPASQSESEAGVINSKRMTPLTTKQAIDAQVGPKISSAIGALNLGSASQSNVEDFATAAQGAKADSAVQPGSPALIPSGGLALDILIKSSSADYDTEWATSTAATAVSYAPQVLTDEQRLQAQSNLSLASFRTVPLLLADELMSYAAGPGKIQVGPGDAVEAGGFRYEIAASDADTAIENSATIPVKLNLMSHVWRPASYGIFSSPVDQKAALQEFINDAADFGAGIDWGRIDLTIDVDDGVPGLRGLGIPANSLWDFHPETVFRALPSVNANYEILNIHDTQNVIIRGNGAQIIGERDQHLGVGGEWGMGLSIRGSTDIFVSDLLISDCWGDGVYVGSTASQNYSQNVALERIHGNNNRRQGLSLISAKGFLAADCRWSNTNGTPPLDGIDIEPNSNLEFLQDIHIVRNKTENNAGSGLQVHLAMMTGSPNPITIFVEDHVDDGSGDGIHFSGGEGNGQNGSITVKNPVLINNKGSGIMARLYSAENPPVRIQDPVIIDPNRRGSAAATYGSAILLHAPSGDGGVNQLGNIHIDGATIKLNSGSITNLFFMWDQRPGALESSYSFTNPKELPVGVKGFGPTSGRLKLADSNRVFSRMLPDGSDDIGSYNIYSSHIAPTLTATRTYTLQDTIPLGMEFEIGRSTGGGVSNFRFPEEHSVTPGGPNTGRVTLGTNEAGARMTLVRDSATVWRIISQIGTWGRSEA